MNYGIHPFTGVASDHGDYPAELAGRIKQSLYPYGRIANQSVRKVPASVHEAFPDNLRRTVRPRLCLFRLFGGRARMNGSMRWQSTPASAERSDVAVQQGTPAILRQDRAPPACAMR